jgi:hypothetical protein
MRSRQRRRRDRRSAAARELLQRQAGFFASYGNYANAAPRQRATALVIELGDVLLELLVEAAVSSARAGASRAQRSEDERTLTAALEDPQRVTSAWVLLAHGLVQWALGRTRAPAAPGEASAADDAALWLLRDQYPLDEHDRRTLAIAPDAERLGYVSEEHLVASAAFETLIGERTVALFADGDPEGDRRLLHTAFARAERRYRDLLAEGMIAAAGRPGQAGGRLGGRDRPGTLPAHAPDPS